MRSGNKRVLEEILGVIFDLDDVLVRSENKGCGNPFHILPECPDSQNGVLAAFEKIRAHVFRSTDWISEIDAAGVDTTNRALLLEISDCVFQVSRPNLIIIPGVEDVAAELYRRKIKLGIQTNNCPNAVEHFYKLCTRDLRHMFSAVKTFMDVPRLKPHPAGLLAIAKEWNMATRNILFLGDSLDDMVAALSAQMPFMYTSWADRDGVSKIPYNSELVTREDGLPTIPDPSWLLEMIPEPR